MSRISVFESMASDIGVRRYVGESDLSFCTRTAYSASKYWVSAFCMDDGQDGSWGVTEQVLGRRLNRWVTALDQVMPGLGRWFEGNGERDMKAIYGRLIDVGDILLAGKKGRCVARPAALEPITVNAALALGFFEPAASDFTESKTTSGLASFVPGDFEAPASRAPWWETDCPYMAWSRASDVPTSAAYSFSLRIFLLKTNWVSIFWHALILLSPLSSEHANAIILLCLRH